MKSSSAVVISKVLSKVNQYAVHTHFFLSFSLFMFFFVCICGVHLYRCMLSCFFLFQTIFSSWPSYVARQKIFTSGVLCSLYLQILS